MARTLETIALVEGVTRSLERESLTDSAALAIHKNGKVQIDWPSPATGFKYQLRSSDVVGQIPIGEKLVIRVAPKVPVRNLFQMLEVAYNLKSFELHDGIVSVDDLPDLVERLASILAKRVLDRIRRGLYRAYLNDEASLPYVRGRIDVRETTRLLTGGAPAVHCQFQEHTSDLDDNQILLWTLQVISRLGLKRSDVVADVRAARRALVGAAALRSVNARECIGRMYNRLNDDYRPMHGLCRFFLENTGPGLAHGENELIPFTVNMPRLFELFVAEWLRQNVGARFEVKAQHKVHLTEAQELAFTMDIVLSDRLTHNALAVLDTKYKFAIQPDLADVQQVVAYAVKLGVDRAVLIYPTAVMPRQTLSVGHVSVGCNAFDLGADIDQAGRTLLSSLGLADSLTDPATRPP